MQRFKQSGLTRSENGLVKRKATSDISVLKCNDQLASAENCIVYQGDIQQITKALCAARHEEDR